MCLQNPQWQWSKDRCGWEAGRCDYSYVKLLPRAGAPGGKCVECHLLQSSAGTLSFPLLPWMWSLKGEAPQGPWDCSCLVAEKQTQDTCCRIGTHYLDTALMPISWTEEQVTAIPHGLHGLGLTFPLIAVCPHSLGVNYPLLSGPQVRPWDAGETRA
jgi:hypothetical protein